MSIVPRLYTMDLSKPITMNILEDLANNYTSSDYYKMFHSNIDDINDVEELKQMIKYIRNYNRVNSDYSIIISETEYALEHVRDDFITVMLSIIDLLHNCIQNNLTRIPRDILENVINNEVLTMFSFITLNCSGEDILQHYNLMNSSEDDQYYNPHKHFKIEYDKHYYTISDPDDGCHAIIHNNIRYTPLFGEDINYNNYRKAFEIACKKWIKHTPIEYETFITTFYDECIKDGLRLIADDKLFGNVFSNFVRLYYPKIMIERKDDKIHKLDIPNNYHERDYTHIKLF